MIKNKLFNNDIIILNQSIKAIYYTTKFEEDLFFNENPNLDYSCEYEILTHKENPRDFIMILEYNVVEPSDIELKNEFHIIVQGHFEISENVKENEIDDAKHFGSLSLLLSFLRTAVFNITSMTTSGSHNIPLINAKELHDSFIKKNKSRKSSKQKKVSQSKTKKS